MRIRWVPTVGIDRAPIFAEYNQLEDGSLSGRIPACKGIVALGASLRDCQNELRSTLEDQEPVRQ
ncbi:MAG: hypothetical protein ACRERS_09025 [Methylococcales bacterium]